MPISCIDVFWKPEGFRCSCVVQLCLTPGPTFCLLSAFFRLVLSGVFWDSIFSSFVGLPYGVCSLASRVHSM